MKYLILAEIVGLGSPILVAITVAKFLFPNRLRRTIQVRLDFPNQRIALKAVYLVDTRNPKIVCDIVRGFANVPASCVGHYMVAETRNRKNLAGGYVQCPVTSKEHFISLE
jgi:hypothetical protein